MRDKATAYLHHAIVNPTANFRPEQWEYIDGILRSQRQLVVQNTNLLMAKRITKRMIDKGIGLWCHTLGSSNVGLVPLVGGVHQPSQQTCSAAKSFTAFFCETESLAVEVSPARDSVSQRSSRVTGRQA